MGRSSRPAGACSASRPWAARPPVQNCKPIPPSNASAGKARGAARTLPTRRWAPRKRKIRAGGSKSPGGLGVAPLLERDRQIPIAAEGFHRQLIAAVAEQLGGVFEE